MENFVKHKKGKQLGYGEKQLLFNILTYRQTHSSLSVTQIIKHLSLETGISPHTILKIKQEGTSSGITHPRKPKKHKKHSNSRDVIYDEVTRSTIRRIIHGFFASNSHPTVKSILHKVNNTENLPSFTISTLYRLVCDIGFKYSKHDKKAVLIEKTEIISWRHRYLRAIKKYRESDYNIVFLDESWVNIGHTCTKVWTDTKISNVRQAFNEGLTTGIKPPTSRGPRYVLLHAGSKNGFVKGAEMTFLAKKSSGDYHEEMDGPLFEKWFREQLIPNIPQKTVVVMDNASYHSRKQEKIPNNSWTKPNIKNWLTEKDFYFEDDYLKDELLDVVNTFRGEFDKYIIDEVAKEANIILLRLPPYHCELNPIELVWSDVKRYIAKNNIDFKKDSVKNLISEAYSQVSSEKWNSYVSHTVKVEEEMWKTDNLMDDIEPVIININTESDQTSESDSD